MNEKEQKQFEDWKTKHLPIITGAFKMVIEEMGPIPIGVFNHIAAQLAQEAYDTFAKELGLDTPEKIPVQFSTDLFVAIVGGLNSVLPLSYEYIVVSIFSDQSPNLRFGVADRKTIPGAHDIINPYIVPIFQMKNMKLPEGESAIRNVKIADVFFSNNDENLDKKNPD